MFGVQHFPIKTQHHTWWPFTQNHARGGPNELKSTTQHKPQQLYLKLHYECKLVRNYGKLLMFSRSRGVNSYACFHMVSGSLLAAAHANEVNKWTAVSGQGTHAFLHFCSLGSLYECTNGTSGPKGPRLCVVKLAKSECHILFCRGTALTALP